MYVKDKTYKKTSMELRLDNAPLILSAIMFLILDPI